MNAFVVTSLPCDVSDGGQDVFISISLMSFFLLTGFTKRRFFFFVFLDLFLKDDLEGLLNEFSALQNDGGLCLIEYFSVGRTVSDFLNVPKIGLGLFEKQGFGFGVLNSVTL